MHEPIDIKGLSRIVDLELGRLVPGTREEAMKAMKDRIGVYDLQGEAIEAGVDAYFSALKYNKLDV